MRQQNASLGKNASVILFPPTWQVSRLGNPPSPPPLSPISLIQMLSGRVQKELALKKNAKKDF